jgi:DNA-directed RNA polymerase subunit RPC12/RpoP
MINGPIRLLRVKCIGCGMIIKVSPKEGKGDLRCSKCGGRRFEELNSETEVITK